MTNIAEVLNKHGFSNDDGALAAELDHALTSAPGVDAESLPQQELDYLAEHGGPDAAAAVAKVDPKIAHRRRAVLAMAGAADLAEATLSTEQAATLLKVDRTRIAHRLREGSLWSIRVGGSRRVPSWQIVDGQVLPHLVQVISAIPPDAHPADVHALMSTEQDELGGRTPTHHLATGGDPAPVAAMLSQINRW